MPNKDPEVRRRQAFEYKNANRDHVKNNFNKIKRRRAAFLRSFRQYFGCADCGYDENAVAMAFDHLPEYEKVNKVSELKNAAFTRLLDEMAKCEVVCHNCHAIRTQERLVGI